MTASQGFNKKKWIGSIVGILVLLIVILGALLPTILSSEAGTKFLIERVKRATGGDLKLEDLSLSWIKEQRIDKLEYIDQEGFELFFDSLSSDCSFLNLLFHTGSIGTTQIVNPKIIAYSKISEKRVEEFKKRGEGKFWSDFKGHLILTNGQMVIKNGGNSVTSFYGVKGDIDVGSNPSFLLEGKTRRNEQLGSFFIEGKKQTFLEGTASIIALPTEGIDELFALFYPKYKGLAYALLGDTLNASIKAAATNHLLNIEINLRSPRLLVDLNPTYGREIFELTKPGRIALTLKPFLFNHFFEEFSLQSDAQGELRLEKGSLPFSGSSFDFSKASGNGDLYLSSGKVLVKKIEDTLFVDQFKGAFSTESLGTLVQINVQSSMRYQEEGQSSVNGTVSIKDLFKKRTFPSMNLAIDNLPLVLIDQYQQSSLVKYLGKTYTGNIVKSNERLSVSGKTPLLTFQETSLEIADTAHLIKPSDFTYTITPNLYENLAHPFNVQGTLNALVIPVDNGSLAFKESDFDLTFNTDQITMKNLFAIGEAFFPSVQGKLKRGSLDTIEFNASGVVDYNEGSWGYSILGENVTVKGDGKLRFGREFEISPLNLSFQGRKLQGDIVAAIENKALLLKKGVQVDFLLEPTQINPILSKDPEYPLLTQATPLRLEIKPSKIPLTKGALSSLSLKGSGLIQDLSMVNPANRYPFYFRDVHVDFDLDGAKKSHMIHFEGDALEKDRDGGNLKLLLTGSGEASKLISSPNTVKATMSHFSSQIADVFFKTRGQLPDLVGPTIDLEYQMKKTGEKQSLDLQIDSRDLTLEGAFYAGKTLELQSPRKPLKIRWNLSEASYDALRRWRNPNKQMESNNPLFEIEQEGELKMQVSQLSTPLKDQGEGFPKPDFNLFQSVFDAAIHIDHLKLKQGRTAAVTELDNFKLEIIKTRAGNEPLSFKFNGNVSPFENGKNGHLRGEGKIKDFLLSSGDFDFANITTSIHAKVQNLPSVFVDALSKLDQTSQFPPSAFLGDLFNATFDAEVEKSQGKVTMDVNASGCRANFSGVVSHGILYLHEPLKALFTVTPELNRILEKSAKLYVASMEKPISLYIHDDGFAVPLKNLHIRNMSFKYGELDLGQILCKNTGSTEEVGGLFKSENRGDVHLWFTPAIFNMNQGVVYVDRTEILYNKAYQVCLWGNILFPRRYVDMTLGLTAEALRSALGIQGINDDYVLKVPVEGPFGNVKIDTGAATAKIAFLVARKHIAPQAGVWGQVLGAVGDLADDQSDVPPPRPPFPWQKKR
ncbi:MAG: hypothetical protein KDK76_02735 [Chlamydiia bacterium]|nr:hypothetical protein [Chlamydiia bacterium]